MSAERDAALDAWSRNCGLTHSSIEALWDIVARIKADAYAEGWNRAYADMHETPPACDGSCGEREPHGLHHEPLA